VKKIILIILINIFTVSAHAEVIKIGLSKQGNYSLETPSIGMDLSEVKSTFGAPLSTKGPTGQPPITLWQYDSFSVYFEGEHVIHSVIHHIKKETVSEKGE